MKELDTPTAMYAIERLIQEIAQADKRITQLEKEYENLNTQIKELKENNDVSK